MPLINLPGETREPKTGDFVFLCYMLTLFMDYVK